MKARFVTQIWKPCKSKENAESEDDKQKVSRRMIMVKAAFFGISQVKPIKEER